MQEVQENALCADGTKMGSKMTDPYTTSKKRLDDEAFDGWVLTDGTPPGRKTGHMLCMLDKLGKPYAVGVGESELEACNALVSDMERRARQWTRMLLIVRNCRKAMRIEAGEIREERSKSFLSSPNMKV